MYIYINSPYDGQPVKIREQDIQRAVRDGENRIFYVLMRSDGNGYYGSITRAGGPREEQQYLAMQAKQARAMDVGKERSAAQIRPSSKSRSSSRGKMVICFFILLTLGMLALWALTVGPWGNVKWKQAPLSNLLPGNPQSSPQPGKTNQP